MTLSESEKQYIRNQLNKKSERKDKDKDEGSVKLTGARHFIGSTVASKIP